MTVGGTVILGGRGLVGSAIARATQVQSEHVLSPFSAELDLRDRNAVGDFFERHRPRRVYLAAAIVGGILENSRNPVPFINDNILIQTHVLQAAYRTGVEHVMLLGSSCIYPRACRQPMCESDLMTGPLEPTNSAYAMAKLAGLEQVLAYNRQFGTRWLYVIPPNVYGPRDHFFSDKSHVISALITRVHEGKREGASEIAVWGTGSARREFIYVEDLARMLVKLMEMPDVPTPINTGNGSDVSIRELAETIIDVIGYRGVLSWDTTKPDGMPRKLMDSSVMIGMGVAPRIGLRDGLALTYRWFVDNYDEMAKSKQA